MPIDKNFYNEASAAKLGWEPSWFGEKYFDDQLVRAIKKWQKERGITSDGLCGPATYRRIWTERQSNIDDHIPDDKQYSNYIVYNGQFFPINWPKVVLWSERGGLKARNGSHYDYTGRPKRPIRLFVNHWDVCLSSKACQSVLDKRGISVHFLIDNDGTIYQTLDMQHGAWHAGSERVNRASVGVEISNAFYPRYQDWYKKNGFGERPILSEETVHGKSLGEFTGFYDVQLEALKALWKAVHKATGIPLKCPTDKEGNTLKKVSTSAAANNFKGFVSHYHLTNRKIDCAGLDINSMLKDIK